MNVLVVDDDRTTRFLLRRALTNDLACQVLEAGDGQEALKVLEQVDVGLVVLDVQMPRVDGVETLRRIRANAETRAVPVVMLTAERTEDVVRQIVQLGVLDYMTKPLTPTRVTERVKRVLAWLSAENRPSAAHFLAEGLSLLDARPRMLVLDGDEAYRVFFAETLGPEQAVLQARSGVDGLRICVDSRPEVVFVGDGLGVLGEALFVRKIRAHPVLQHTQLIAIMPSGGPRDRASHQEGYNGRITRTNDPALLLQSVKSLLRPSGGGLQELMVMHPALREAIVSGTEQVMGMMLETDVELRPQATAPPAERLLVRQRGLWSVNTPGVDFTVACDERTGRAIAGHLIGIDPAMVTQEDVESALAEVFNMISGRLRTALANKGLRLEFELPEAEKSNAPIGADPGQDSMTFSFRSPAANLDFWLTLSTAKPAAVTAA